MANFLNNCYLKAQVIPQIKLDSSRTHPRSSEITLHFDESCIEIHGYQQKDQTNDSYPKDTTLAYSQTSCSRVRQNAS
jgi:hypothetical protein